MPNLIREKIMKMRNLILLFAFLGFFSCNSDINITDPFIQIEGGGVEYYTYDSLLIHVIQSAEIDGNKVPADYFDWTITQSSTNKVILFQNSNSDHLAWFPTEKGKYLISVKIGYDGNKS